MTEQQIADAYARAYANAPFVRVLPAGQAAGAEERRQHAARGDRLPAAAAAAAAPSIVSVIDNLLKGAASQAVQNFNRMCGFAETEALV